MTDRDIKELKDKLLHRERYKDADVTAMIASLFAEIARLRTLVPKET